MMKSLFILLLAVGYSLQTPVEVEEEYDDSSFVQDDDVTNTRANFSTTSRFLGQKRYYIGIFFKANWFRAAQFCRYNGMQLASIKSQEEQDILEKQIRDFGMTKENFWTSGTDKAKENSFFWMSNGKPFTYTNWHKGQPDNVRAENGETEDCVELWNINNSGYHWNDLLCSYENFFVCEY